MPAPRVTSNSPWHLVFVLDDSESMTGAAANTLNQALEEMKLLSQGTKPYFKISVIVFGSHVKVIAEAESEQTLDKAKVTSFSGTSGTTDMAAALNEAATLLKRRSGNANDFDPYVFLL